MHENLHEMCRRLLKAKGLWTVSLQPVNHAWCMVPGIPEAENVILKASFMRNGTMTSHTKQLGKKSSRIHSSSGYTILSENFVLFKLC